MEPLEELAESDQTCEILGPRLGRPSNKVNSGAVTLFSMTAQIEASFQETIKIAKEQKSVSLEKRAEATYSEYRRRKALGEHAFRLPLS